MKKTIKTVIYLLLLLICTLAVTAAALWYSSCRTKIELPELKTVLDPADGAVCGKSVTGTLTFILPLCAKVENIKVANPEGTVCTGVPQAEWKLRHFNRRTWQIKFRMRPLRSGSFASGKVMFDAVKRSAPPLQVTAEIPSFEAKYTGNAEKLELASAVETGGKSYLTWYWLLLLLIPAGVLLAKLLRRPAKARELTEWEKAVRELTGLRKKIDSGNIAPEQAFIDLTELMRRYLERRYGLPVTRSTAQEFAGIMEKYGSRFPESSRPFLRDFLDQADMVKFARMIPENSRVVRSAESAGDFLEHTRPESEVKNV